MKRAIWYRANFFAPSISQKLPEGTEHIVIAFYSVFSLLSGAFLEKETGIYPILAIFLFLFSILGSISTLYIARKVLALKKSFIKLQYVSGFVGLCLLILSGIMMYCHPNDNGLKLSNNFLLFIFLLLIFHLALLSYYQVFAIIESDFGLYLEYHYFNQAFIKWRNGMFFSGRSISKTFSFITVGVMYFYLIIFFIFFFKYIVDLFL